MKHLARKHSLRFSALVGLVAVSAIQALPAAGLQFTAGPVGTQHVAQETVTLDQGHIDAFFVKREGKGISMKLREDVTGKHVLRSPETVNIVLNDKAKLDVPQGFPAPAGPAWVIGQTQKSGVVWTGWSSEDLAGAFGRTDIAVKMDGPAPVYLWSSGMDASKPVSLLAGGGFTLPGTIVIPEPAHVHANWVFTKPGVYTFRARATATPQGGGAPVSTKERTYKFFVGVPVAEQPKPEPVKPEPVKPEPVKPEPVKPEPVKPEPTPEPVKPEPVKPEPVKPEPTPEPVKPEPVKPAPTPEPVKPEPVKPEPTPEPVKPEPVKPEPTPEPVKPEPVKPEPTPEPVKPEPVKPAPTPEPEKPQPSTPGTPSTPSNPAPGQPDLGNAKPIAPAPQVPAPQVPAPKAPAPQVPAPKAPAPQAPAPKSPLAPANTAGEDCQPVEVKAPAQAAAGAGAGAGASVGAPGEQVSSGHFDAGPILDGNTLRAKVKDDRKAPATWRSPSAMTFKLGNAARKTLPAGLEFIGKAGQPVWLIGNVQERSVPWLGVNTQHESLSATTGEVTYRLNSVQGPGKVALWSAGAFGSGVGARLADNVGGPRQFVIPPNTHMHPAWAFTQPGNYRLNFTMSVKTKDGQTVSSRLPLYFKVGDAAAASPSANPAPASKTKTFVGKTPSGKDCTLNATQVAQVKAQGGMVLPTGNLAGSQLAKTGADGINQMLTLGSALLLGGIAVMVISRRVNTK